MPIRVITSSNGFLQLKTSFSRNWQHYLQEGLGLGIFMVSACLFSALLEAKHSPLHQYISNGTVRTMIIALLMGATAVFIFYSSWTSPSGAQINPAVTLVFLRLGKMCQWDALFYIIFQFLGGTLAVYLMQLLLGHILIDLPVNSAVTVPGKAGTMPALITEFLIAFTTMIMVLFTSAHHYLKKYTSLFAGLLVCIWVIVAGPVSGFGMNPARTFASALPSNIWTAYWLYLLAPTAGMLLAAELFLFIQQNQKHEKK